VTDSACSLPADVARQNGVTIVPMWLVLGGTQYRDGDLSSAEVTARWGPGVSTSAPAPGEIAGAIERADQGDGVVVLTVSRRMSAVYDAARLAASSLDGTACSVIDTGTAAGAQGLVVLAASAACRAGAPLAEVAAAASEAAAQAKLLATVPSLEYLARGGRVPGAAAWGARWLGLHPLFEFRRGRVWPLRPARGRRSALSRMVGACARDAAAGHAGRLHVAALHVDDPTTARDLLDELGRRVPLASSFLAPFSAVMVAHTGPGLAGLAWWAES